MPLFAEKRFEHYDVHIIRVMTPVAPARNDESREALNENRSSIGGPTDGSGLTPEQVPAVIADMQHKQWQR